jgi:NAD dependent epimerase/dehydratase
MKGKWSLMNPGFWFNKKVLVTGAGGFIGSHLVESLIRQGAQTRALVRYNSRNDSGLLRFLPADIASNIELIAGDIRDLTAVQKSMLGVTHVFHLGALIAIPYSYLHPAEVVETNVIGTLNILMAAQAAGVERVVHTSTSEVYGTALQVPIDESHPLQGQSPYSASKIGADKLAESFFCTYNLPVVTLRPFNTFGPRQSARAVIPTMIMQALSRDVIRLGNLDTTRDFTYVLDTVAGFLKAGQMDGIEGKTINLGTGQEIRVGDLVQKIISLVGRPVRVEVDSARLRPEKSEVQRLLSNNQLAKSLLAWQPEVSFEEGLQHTIAWFEQNLALYSPDRYVV